MSSLTPEINFESHNRCQDIIRQIISKKYYKVAYLEYRSDPTNYYMNKTNVFYDVIGEHEIKKIDLDLNYNENERKSIFDYDVLHLSSGNTFDFLWQLKRRNFLEIIREFSKMNKLIVGHSAGSLLPSQTIGTAIYGDENEINIKDLKSLALIDFEFFPHWNEWAYFLEDLKEYSRKNQMNIFLVEDGEGIIIDDDRKHIIGNIRMIENGIYQENGKFT